MADSTKIILPDAERFKRQALHWAAKFPVVCLLDSNDYPGDPYRSKNWVLAVDATNELNYHSGRRKAERGAPFLHKTEIPDGGNNPFEQLQHFQSHADSTIFGFLTYDLKNQIENLGSSHPDGLQFPEMYFFKPRYLFEINGSLLTLNRNYPETFEILHQIEKMLVPGKEPGAKAPRVVCSTPKKQYLRNVKRIKQQIAEGDYYELNYCLEFKTQATRIDPVHTFHLLNEKAKAPFSCFFKCYERYLLCASPERFLKKERNKLISPPMKGTIKKGKTTKENVRLQQRLKSDIKERAENVMIVDLVRNDLARSSVPGSVKVEELFGVYEFASVNQMVSTVVSKMKKEVHFTDALKHAYPMGSMTGAPKIEVMKNIERFENFKRGLYSGSVGYITSKGDFDFNVVIRSILYNSETGYLSLPAGGAITYDSDPEKEYDEILLKAKDMMKVLSGR